MDDQHKTREQLILEINSLREEIGRLKDAVPHTAPLPGETKEINWASEAAFRTILKNAQTIIFAIDDQGIFQVSEGEGLASLGYKPGQVVGMSAYEIYKDVPRIIALIKSALAGSNMREMVTIGHLVFDAFFSPYQDLEGRVIGVLGMALDITDRIEALDQLYQITQIVEQTTVGILHTDADFKITYINRAAEDLYGWTLDELAGKMPDIFNVEPLSEEIQAKIYTTVAEGRTYHGEALNVRKDGSTFQCEMDVSALSDGDGNHTGYFSILKDVTERTVTKRNLERKLSETSILQEASSVSAAMINEDQVIAAITDLLSENFYSDHLGVMLLDQAKGLLLPHYSYKGISPEDFSTRIPVGTGVCGKVIETGQPMIVPDVTNFPGYVHSLAQMRSEICTPLIVSDKAIGVINVESKKLDAFTEEDMQLLTTIAGQLATSIERIRLYRELLHSNEELSSAYDSTLLGWANALELRDHETQGHTLRVTDLAGKLAAALGMQEPELTHLRRGALLHDIGKIGIPDAILFKPGPLTDQERAIIQQHPIYGRNLLSQIPFLEPALDIPLYHHEYWDGNGYPKGLAGEEIPLAARIFAIVDVWDALTSTRPYRPAWNRKETLDYIRSSSGTQFDPELVPVFIKVLEEIELLP